MHDLPIRINPDRTAAKALMADLTVVLLPDDDLPRPAALSPPAGGVKRSDSDLAFGADFAHAFETADDALLAQHGGGVADAAEE
ncbi:hypothetical protein LTR28_012599, partial [Elasticomyces elasticus]